MAQPRPYDQENKVTALMHLRDEVMHRGCPSGGTPLFGVGSPTASIMLIGESPRGIEERAGKPLAGRSLDFLKRSLHELGVPFSSVWLTNAVKCRTTRLHGERLYERPPTSEEVEEWLPVLMREIEILRPRVIVCLGVTASGALLGRKDTIRDLRGRWFEGPLGARLVVTYHPTYLLCKRGSSKQVETARFLSDLREAISLIK